MIGSMGKGSWGLIWHWPRDLDVDIQRYIEMDWAIGAKHLLVLLGEHRYREGWYIGQLLLVIYCRKRFSFLKNRNILSWQGYLPTPGLQVVHK